MIILVAGSFVGSFATMPGATAAPAASATVPAKKLPACAAAIGKAPGASEAGAAGATAITVQTNSAGGAILDQPGLHVDLKAPTPAPPKINATAWMVTDLESGQIIAACNAHLRLAPASTLKTLTAITLAGRLDWNAVYTASAEDAGADGTRVGVVPGSKYRIKDLFHGLMLASGNDTAQALANAAGGMAATRSLMMAKAVALGAADTNVVNDSGLDANSQATSAYDLSLFGRAALADPLVAKLITTHNYQFPAAGQGFSTHRKTFMISSHNWLLTNVPGTLGVKNGYTIAAGGSYVVAVRRGGHTYLVALLRADGAAWHMAADLVGWAFATHGQASPVATLDNAPVPAASASPTPSATSPTTTASAGPVQESTTGPPATTVLWPWAAAGFVVLVTLLGLFLILRHRGRAVDLVEPGSGPQLLS
jgi:D-alanyl-D-alanine carboxypeptidase (penicillin-binding protein 5/6)